MDTIIITGSGGLVGSEAVKRFTSSSKLVIGLDINARQDWFGQGGSVETTIDNNRKYHNYKHFSVDVCDKIAIENFIKGFTPSAVIHCAAQPSHEKSAEIPYEDFQVNTVGTVNLLEAIRKHSPKTSFVFTSTNKVYGDRPNLLPMKLGETRYELLCDGVDETMSLDESVHSPFGANKAAADLIVQEYGRYYSINTVCFRCGCITGARHQGVEQHGFLSHLCKIVKFNQPYTIFGHKGMQVRDNIHSSDLVDAFVAYLDDPTPGAVYNIGGGRENSCSIIEAIQKIEDITGIKIQTKFGEARKGDHLCYLTNNNRFRKRYPSWQIKYSLDRILRELLDA